MTVLKKFEKTKEAFEIQKKLCDLPYNANKPKVHLETAEEAYKIAEDKNLARKYLTQAEAILGSAENESKKTTDEFKEASEKVGYTKKNDSLGHICMGRGPFHTPCCYSSISYLVFSITYLTFFIIFISK